MSSDRRRPTTAAEIREGFLKYFEERDHLRVESASLVPSDDPTLLFTNAGMVPFKDAFLGRRPPPHPRATSAQKCVRAGGKHNDLEMVGATPRHQTFFEMMGNFSFGDYFKPEAIGFAWEFLTDVLGLSPERLWVSVYRDDDEAAALWREIAPEVGGRLVRLGEEDNFWSMGDTGPCGPCSEIIYDRGAEHGCSDGCAIGVCDCDRWLEIWNLVFMQYDRDEGGNLAELERKGIDTGMGLERVASILQAVDSNYDTDLFAPLIEDLEDRTGLEYAGGDAPEDFAFRVIADHIRSCAFLVADGVFPGNEGRGYVLRRILRRAYRYGATLGIDGAFLHSLLPRLVEIMGEAYPELSRGAESIGDVIRREEERFASTLASGMHMLEGMLDELDEAGEDTLAAGQVFTLYDTFGFPPDLSEDVARERGLEVDRDGFEELMKEQRRRARAARDGAEGEKRDLLRVVGELAPTEFVGYDHAKVAARLVALVASDERISGADAGEVVAFLDRTSFHPEGGGQVGDIGSIAGPGGEMEVRDTRELPGGIIAHFGRMRSGSISEGQTVAAAVDEDTRMDVSRHHTATHLLHAALKATLGDHVAQAGSLVEAKRLRFDFTQPEPLTPEQVGEVEDRVNGMVLQARPVQAVWMDRESAMKSDVVALFGDTYAEPVRVVSIEGVSRELCGGNHVENTGQIGTVKILSEESIGSGLRRLEVLAGWPALEWIRNLAREREEMARELDTSPENVGDRVRGVIEEVRDLRRQGQRLQARLADRQARDLGDRGRRIGDVTVLAERVEASGPDNLREMADSLRDELGECAFLLASAFGDKVQLVGAATPGAVSRGAHMGDVVRKLGQMLEGGGGGRPDMAQAGGARPDLLEDVLVRGEEMIAGQLGEGGDDDEE